MIGESGIKPRLTMAVGLPWFRMVDCCWIKHNRGNWWLEQWRSIALEPWLRMIFMINDRWMTAPWWFWVMVGAGYTDTRRFCTMYLGVLIMNQCEVYIQSFTHRIPKRWYAMNASSRRLHLLYNATYHFFIPVMTLRFLYLCVVLKSWSGGSCTWATRKSLLYHQ